MLLKQLLEHFDLYENLHIEVNSVRDQLVERGVQDEIKFHFVDSDPAILRGLLYRYTSHSAPYSAPILCSHICISSRMPKYWQRLVAVKELIHITDSAETVAQTEKEVETLIQRMAYPYDIALETASSKNDRFTLILALAVLIPKECRIHVRRLFLSGAVGKGDIARMAQIPARYVDVILEDWFDEFISTFIAESSRPKS